jgi:hypothetical protein
MRHRLTLSDLLTLAVEVMFIHRKIDEIKRRGLWLSRLCQIAVYAVETTAPNDFSSSKGSEHSEQMKQRALTDILPSLFEIATSYENHVVKFGLFEGSRKVDPGTGKQHTWQAIPRPARKLLARKRARGNRVDGRELTYCDGSAEESSPDDSRSDRPRAASSTAQFETSSPRAPTGASKQVVASNGSHASIGRQQGPPPQSILPTTTSSSNYSKDSHLLHKAEIPLHGSHSAYHGRKMGIEGQAFQTAEQSVVSFSDPLMSIPDVKGAMEGTQAQTQTPYEISPHGSHLLYDGFGTDFKGPTTQPIGWSGSEVSYSMGGLPYFPGNWNPCLIYSKYHVNDIGYGCGPGTCYGSFDGSTYTSLEPC